MARFQEARTTYETSLAIRENALGTEQPHVAGSLDNLAAVLGNIGEHARAVANHERALAILEKALGPSIRMWQSRSTAWPSRLAELSRPFLILDELLLVQDKPAESVKVLQRALALAGSFARAEIQLVLAQAIWAVGRDRERAVEQAREARDYYRQIGNQPMLEKAARWLAEHELTR